MSAPSVTYTFANSTTSDATQVNQNFTDLINGASDGTKDYSISALTCAGNATFNGNTTIGNASSDTLTITASLASSIAIATTYSYDIGSATVGLRKLYLGASDSAARSVALAAGAVSASYTLTLPTAVAAANNSVIEHTTGGVGSFRQLKTPTITKYTSGTSQTHAIQSGTKWARITMVGGGGGGGCGGGTVTTGGGNGGDTSLTNATWTLTAAGGVGGTNNAVGGTGGAVTVTGLTGVGTAGSVGGPGHGSYVANIPGGDGGSSALGGAGSGGLAAGSAGTSAATNSGSGGGGGGSNSNHSGSGGGSGAYIQVITTDVSGTWTYSVGASGSAGTGTANGGAGGAGLIIIEEFYQ